jgi:hypothetical protein
VVGDGSEILTTLNPGFEVSNILDVVAPGYGQYQASVQKIDAKTRTALLKLEGANLPAAATGTADSLQVTYQGWGYSNSSQITFVKFPALISDYQLPSYPSIFTIQLLSTTAVIGWPDITPGIVITNKNGKVVGLEAILPYSIESNIRYIPVVHIEDALKLISLTADQ